MNEKKQDIKGRTGAIAGQVSTILGYPVKDATIVITGTSPTHRDIGALTNEEGEFLLDELLPGEYTVLVNAEGFGIKVKGAKVEAGKITRLEFFFDI